MRLLPALPLLLALGAAPAAAHHGWGSYKTGAAATLGGTIERVETGGAHATAWVKVGDRTVELVLAPPSRMRNRGLPPDRLVPGEQIEFLAYPHRANPAEMRAEWIRVGTTTAQLR